MSEATSQSDKFLKNKQICRFCLTQDHTILSGIFDKNYTRFKSCAPLPIQVLACTSIEIFFNDGMPVTVCDRCRMILDYCYRVKLICKKSDLMLRQYPLTHAIPPTLSLPKIPEEIVKSQLQMTRLNSRSVGSSVPENYNTLYASPHSRQNPRPTQPPMEPNINAYKLQPGDQRSGIQHNSH